jgi:hypothetical protein
MSRKKLSTTIYVTPEQNDALKILHARTKVPIAVYIREGIDMVLRTYSHLLPGQLPLAALDEQVRDEPLAAGKPSAARTGSSPSASFGASAVGASPEGAASGGSNHGGQHAASGGKKSPSAS